MALEKETLRFGELRRKIGSISERMLAQTLRHMEEDGFIKRVDHGVIPPCVDYTLTPLGHQVQERVAGLAEWFEMNLQTIIENRRDFAAHSAREAAEKDTGATDWHRRKNQSFRKVKHPAD